MTSDRIVDNTGDVIEHGDHGLTLSPERRKDVEASIRAAGLTSRAARRGDDADLRKRRTDGTKGIAEWPRTVTLEDVLGLQGMLQAQYRLLMPSARRTGIPGIDSANAYLLKSRWWKGLGPDDRLMEIDLLIVERGRRLLEADVKAGLKGTRVLNLSHAAIIRAMTDATKDGKATTITAHVLTRLRDIALSHDRKATLLLPPASAQEGQEEAQARHFTDGIRTKEAVAATYKRNERTNDRREEQIGAVETLLRRSELANLRRVFDVMKDKDLISFKEAAKIAGVNLNRLKHEQQMAKKFAATMKLSV